MLTVIRWLAAALSLTLILLVPAAHAQTGPRELRVVTRVLPPLVVG